MFRRAGSSAVCYSLLLATLVLAQTSVCLAQNLDDYRSRATGKWNKKSTWQRFDGTAWKNNPPVPTDSDGLITIRAAHIITVNKRYNLDELVVDAGATLIVNKRIRVQNGPGTDLSLNGLLQVGNKNVVMITGSSGIVSSTGTLSVPKSNYRLRGTSGMTFSSGSVLNTSGTGRYSAEQQSLSTFDAGSTVNNGNNFRIRNSAVVNSSGSFIQTGTFQLQNTSQLNFLSGSVYEHARNGGSFPVAARTSWASGSTARVTGVTATVPSNLNHAFHHFEWNAAGQTSDINLAGSPLSFGGNFTVTSTGSAALIWVQNASTNMTVSGDYIQTGGTFIHTAFNGAGTLFADNVSVTGGTLDMSDFAGNPTLSMTGNLMVTGSITESGSNFAEIRLNGSATQSIDAASGLTQEIDVVVDNVNGVTLTNDLSGPAYVTILTGTLDLNNFELSVGRDLAVTGDLINPSLVRFNGSFAQSFSYAPGTFSLPELVVDNASATVSLATDLTITSTGSVRIGSVLDINGNTLLLNHAVTLFTGGIVSGNVTMQRMYGLVANGWRMITSPLNGVNFSSLNGVFQTQGAPWATETQGSANLELLNFGIQDWTPLSGPDSPFLANEGYIFYMFKANKTGTPVLASTWTVSGSIRLASSRSLTWNTNSTDSYNYVGNRTASNLDWNSVVGTSTNLGTTYATWDPFLTDGGGLTGYKYYNSASSTGSAGRYIAPFTAFMAQPTAAGGTITFPTSEAANKNSASYFGKNGEEGHIASHIRLQLEGEGLAELETYLTFDDNAVDGSDPYDTDRIQPLSEDFATLNLLSESRRLAFDGRSMKGGHQQFDVEIAATRPGIYEFSWPVWYEIPTDWTISLLDHRDGRVLDMRKTTSMRFNVSQTEVTSSDINASSPSPEQARFSILVSSGNPSPESAFRINTDPVVAQNFPNPFSSSTTVRFSVPIATPVQMDVYDILGRRVESRRSRTYKQGWHEIEFNAGSIAGGIYFYRLMIGNRTFTKSMILSR